MSDRSFGSTLANRSHRRHSSMLGTRSRHRPNRSVTRLCSFSDISMSTYCLQNRLCMIECKNSVIHVPRSPTHYLPQWESVSARARRCLVWIQGVCSPWLAEWHPSCPDPVAQRPPFSTLHRCALTKCSPTRWLYPSELHARTQQMITACIRKKKKEEKNPPTRTKFFFAWVISIINIVVSSWILTPIISPITATVMHRRTRYKSQMENDACTTGEGLKKTNVRWLSVSPMHSWKKSDTK